MTFQVQFHIYALGRQAPELTTSDRTLARIEYNERIRQQGKALSRLQQVVTPIQPLTKSEEYLYLVYEVRHLQHQYFSCGRSPEILRSALQQESRLDKWNASLRFHLQAHPKFTPDDPKAFAFFEVVEAWRERWKAYMAYKKRRDADPAVVKERSKECRDFEKQIDAYVREHIGLL